MWRLAWCLLLSQYFGLLLILTIPSIICWRGPATLASPSLHCVQFRIFCDRKIFHIRHRTMLRQKLSCWLFVVGGMLFLLLVVSNWSWVTIVRWYTFFRRLAQLWFYFPLVCRSLWLVCLRPVTIRMPLFLQVQYSWCFLDWYSQSRKKVNHKIVNIQFWWLFAFLYRRSFPNPLF